MRALRLPIRARRRRAPGHVGHHVNHRPVGSRSTTWTAIFGLLPAPIVPSGRNRGGRKNWGEGGKTLNKIRRENKKHSPPSVTGECPLTEQRSTYPAPKIAQVMSRLLEFHYFYVKKTTPPYLRKWDKLWVKKAGPSHRVPCPLPGRCHRVAWATGRGTACSWESPSQCPAFEASPLAHRVEKGSSFRRIHCA